jgi:2-(3-amino-3-carboxypropyl)histidine synthase
MKVLYIEAQKNIQLDNKKLAELEKILPDTIYIAYTIQYKKLAQEVKKRLKKKISGFQQVLGCSKIETKDTILLLGEARFHALNLASDREVFIFNNHTIEKISREEAERYKQKEKGKISRYLMADKLGIIVSTKPGQCKLDEAFKLKEKLKNKKKAYLFLADNINLQEFENFSLPIYINTACLRLEEDSNIILSINKLKEQKLFT